MLCCFMEIGMFVFGIVTLVRGKFPLSANKVVEGGAARLIGGILMIPFPLAQGIEFTMGLKLGMDAAQKGRQITAMEAQKELLVPALVVNIGSVVLATGLAYGIAFANAKEPERFRREAYDLGEQKYYGDGGGGGGGNPFGGLDDRYRSS